MQKKITYEVSALEIYCENIRDLLSDSDNKFTKQNTQKQIAKNANTSTGMVGMSEVLKAKSPELWEKAKTGNQLLTK